MYPRYASLVIAAFAATLTACGTDTTTNVLPGAEPVVSAPDYAVTLADGTIQLTVGEVKAFTVSARVKKSRTVRWSSSNTTVATVSSTGTVTAKTVGTALVTATASNGAVDNFSTAVVSGTATVATVAKVASVQVSAPAATMTLGAAQTATATARDSAGTVLTGRTVTWSVSAGTSLMVNASGVVTALAGGTENVVATVDGVKGSQAITVATVTSTPTVTSFSISPKTGANLVPWQNRQFTTSVTWSDLAVRAVTVNYSTNGGYIDQNGWFSAGGIAGTFMVIANCSCGRADTAAVVIASTTTSPTAQLTALTISPKSVSLAVGATQQFNTTANWSTGATTLPPIVYTATGGTVSSTGQYVAPSTAGTYRVIVAHSGGTLKDTATVVVASGVQTTSGGTQTAPWSVLRDFNSGALGAKAERTPDGFDDVAGASVYSAEKSFDGTQSAKLSITQGTDGWGTWGGVLNFPSALPAGSDLWIQLYIFIPTDFVISTPGNGSLKFLRVRTKNATGGNGGFNDVQLQDDANQVSSFRMIKEMQDQWFTFGAANSFTKGVWQRVTVNLKLGATPKSAGGFAQTRVWQNGKLLVDESRMQTLNSSSDVADALYLFTYWNGSAPRTQSLWVDKLQIANSQPTWAADLQGVVTPP